MKPDQNIDTIRRLACRAYGSLDDPSLDFVPAAIKKRPYRDVTRALARRYRTEELTDINYQKCFSYICGGRRKTWEKLIGRHRYAIGKGTAVWLSMIARFSMTVRCAGRGITAQVIGPWTDDLTDEESGVLQILEEHDFAILEQQTLETPLRMKLDYCRPDKSIVFNVLFDDVEALPWDSGTWK